MSDIAKFWHLKNLVEVNEEKKREAQHELDGAYKELVMICPHSEALDWNYGNHSGDYRVCMICGLEDRASEGGTPGDEYNYGYPGRPNREFWKGSDIRKAKNAKEFSMYRRRHGYFVHNGKVTSWLNND